jgi:hypothetical protein
MNLLVKNYIFPIFIISILGVFACNKANKVGQELKPQDIGVIFTDTVTVKTSTVLLDSVETANTSMLLMGGYNDAIFGKFTSSTYFGLQPAAGEINFGSNPIFLDASLELVYSYSYGDKSQPITLDLRRLSQSIDSSKKYLQFDTHPFPYTTIGQTTFKLSDRSQNDTIKIATTNSFRDEFVDFIKNKTLISQAEVTNFIKGLAIVPSVNSKFIVGVSTLNPLTVRLVLKYKNDATVSGSFSFFIRTPSSALIVNNRYGSVNFNSIQSDRIASTLSVLNSSSKIIPSENIANQAFIQESVGITTLVEFPYLKDFANISNIAINKADLIIRPVGVTVTDNFPLLSQLEFVLIGNNKLRQRQASSSIDPSTGTTINSNTLVLLGREDAQAQKLNPTLDIISNSYNSEITTYFQFLINSYNTSYTGVNKRQNNGLHLRSSLEGSRAGRMVIGGQKSQYPIQLRVFYTKKL